MIDIKLTRKDFVSDQTVRWCPGCGDYAILAQMQKVMPELGIPKEKFVIISGIGCSSRFPYYMNTYGIHSIHGRAPTLATGLKIANPDLSVWVITGDGDGLSIGGNHLLHTMRRNVDLNIILFNNKIYGLTKGQYSPTSPQGKVTKSSPMGSLESPLNPLSLAIAAEATFVARTIDSNVKHMGEVFRRAAEHKGISFVEVYQNCIIFNDKTWDYAKDPKAKHDNTLILEHGKPMIFGKNKDKGIRLNGLDPEVVSLDEVSENELWVHNEQALASQAYLLSRMRHPQFPEPMGIFRDIDRPTYEEGVLAQVDESVHKKGKGDLAALYHAADTWEVMPEVDQRLEEHQRKIEEHIIGPGEINEEYTGVVAVQPSLFTDTLADLSPKKPLVASVDISVLEAIEILKKRNAGFMALVNADGKVAGIFTEGDVFSKVACQFENLDELPVKEFMTTDMITLTTGSTIAEALHLMAQHRFRHISIVDDDNKPSGIISFRAIVRYLEGSFTVKK